MRHALLGGLCILVAVFSAQAADNNQTYFGAQMSQVTYSIDGLNRDFEPTALVMKLGNRMSDNFSVEGRFGFGIGDGEISGPGGSVSVEVDTILGLYGVGQAIVNDSLAVYGVFGFSRGSLTAEADTLTVSGSESDSDTGLSLGVGANIGELDGLHFNLEYMQYLDKSDYTVDAIGFGVVSTF